MGQVRGHWRDTDAGRIWVAPHDRTGSSVPAGSGPVDPEREAALRAAAEMYATADDDGWDQYLAPPAPEPGIKHAAFQPGAGTEIIVTVGRLFRNGWRNVWRGPNWQDHYPADQPTRPVRSGDRVRDLGIDNPQAWRAAGFSPEEAMMLHDARLDPEEAAGWVAAGFTAREIVDDYDGADLDGAIRARDLAKQLTTTPASLIDWVMGGYDDAEIRDAFERGITDPDGL